MTQPFLGKGFAEDQLQDLSSRLATLYTNLDSH